MVSFLSSSSAWGGTVFPLGSGGILTTLDPSTSSGIFGGGGEPGSAGNPLPDYPNPALAGVAPSYMAPNIAAEYQNYLQTGQLTGGGDISGNVSGLATPSTTIPQSAFSSQGVETDIPGAGGASSEAPGLLEQFGIGAGAGLSGGGTNPDATQQDSGSGSSNWLAQLETWLGGYFIRAAIILLGMIFVAAGLFMFKGVQNTTINVARLAAM